MIKLNWHLKGKRGFTLLELLIVVIIIGILASLAIPRFFRAVERARWSEAKHNIGVLRGSQIRYKAEHGVYTATIGNVDVELTTGKYFTFAVANDADAVATATRNGTEDTFTLTGKKVAIKEEGDYVYTGVPIWLQ